MNIKEKIGSYVVDVNGEVGTITNVDEKMIYVNFNDRDARYELSAFHEGFLMFNDRSLQQIIKDEILFIKLEKQEIEEKQKFERQKEIAKLWDYNDPRKTINWLYGNLRSLRNSYPCEIEYEGITYNSVEAAYQAQKCVNKSDKLKYTDVTPEFAKYLGCQEKNIVEDWSSKSDQIMKNILKIKFSKPEFKEVLLSTGNKNIVYGNFNHDNYWGRCYCYHCERSKFQNKLGNLLMEIREELKN